MNERCTGGKPTFHWGERAPKFSLLQGQQYVVYRAQIRFEPSQVLPEKRAENKSQGITSAKVRCPAIMFGASGTI